MCHHPTICAKLIVFLLPVMLYSMHILNDGLVLLSSKVNHMAWLAPRISRKRIPQRNPQIISGFTVRNYNRTFYNKPSCFPHLLLMKGYTKAYESLYRTLNRNPPATKNFKIDNFNLKNLTHLKATTTPGRSMP